VVSVTSQPSPSTAPAPETVAVERIPWSILGPEFIKTWGYARGGPMPEHVEILGQTGSGKSFFEACILLQRARARGSHIVVIATKPADETMISTGWPVITRYPPDDPRQTAVIFWVQAAGLSKAGQRQQAEKIMALLEKLWRPHANVIIVFDEIAYLCNDLNHPDTPFKIVLAKYYREGRGLGITIVASTQRPQGVIRQVHSESGWTVCFAPKDEEDAERMAQVLGGKKTYLPILKTLNREKYEFLIVHGLTGKMYISWIDHPLPPPLKNGRR
jgi:hypothetical protein